MRLPCAKTTFSGIALSFSLVVAAPCWAQRGPNAPPRLVAHYTFDETEPGRVVDATGAPPITRRGAAVDRPGPMNRAFQFAKRSDRLDTGNKVLLPASDDLTILMWIATRQTSQGSLLSNDGGQPQNASLLVSAGNLRWQHQGGIGEAASPYRISDGRWHLVGVTRLGQLFTLWIDGKPYPAGKSSTPLSQAHNWSIGSNATGTGSVFAGLIDDVRVYHGALDAREIERLFQAGKRDVPGIPAPKKKRASATPAPPTRPNDEIPPAFDPRGTVEP